MIFGDRDRQQLRAAYLQAWRKFRAGQALEPLEKQIAAVIAEHPEYHTWLERGEDSLHSEFAPEGGRQNPFLHLGMHLAIREQVATDRPAGVREVHRMLTGQHGSTLEAEHRMFEALAETLWHSQRTGTLPDESAYRERLERLAAKGT